MDRLAAMEAFVKVAQIHSFTGAADALNVPKTTISRLVNALELRLGVRLLNRTTRHVSLTPEGAMYYEEAVRLLEDLRQSEAAVSSQSGAPGGNLRVDMAHCVANEIIIPVLPMFYARYPDVTLEITSSERIINLVAEGVDCVLRANVIRDETMIARPLGTLEVVTCASPDYLKRCGTPLCLEEVAGHAVVSYYFVPPPKHRGRTFIDGNDRVELRGRCFAGFSDLQSCLSATIVGLGITQVPSAILRTAEPAGKVVRILPQYPVEGIRMYALYPPSRKHSTTLRAFVNWVSEVFMELESDGARLQCPPAQPP